MIINIDSKYRVNFDGANYMPEFFKEGGEMRVAGRDLVTQDSWRSYGKYFMTLSAALSFLARQVIQDTNTELSLAEYIAQLENVLDRFSKLTEA
jgi:hypothetical protein